MISPNDRTATIAWEDLSPKEKGSVLFRAGHLDRIPEGGIVMTSSAIERFISASDRLTPEESERFILMAKWLWEEAKQIKLASLEFLKNSDEGFSDRIVIALGMQKHPVKSRIITSLLSETGAAPKNGRNLLQQLMKAGAVQEDTQEDGGETHFALTDKGLARRDQLLGRG